ncbi:MAG: hypothetical protein Q8P36_00075 [bacterium]|nr:hypothetical protein [bacterium]
MTISSGKINRQQPRPPSNIPYTIRRLRALPQGKEAIYYRGDFDTDIAACDPTRRGDRGAPGYGALLRSVRGIARDLAAQGRVILLERGATHASPKGDFRVTEYVAIGNAP